MEMDSILQVDCPRHMTALTSRSYPLSSKYPGAWRILLLIHQLSLIFNVASAQHLSQQELPRSYSNCSLIRVKVPVQGQVEELEKLIEEVSMQIWQPVKASSKPGDFADFVLPAQKEFLWDMKATAFSHSVMFGSLESAIQTEANSMLKYGGVPDSGWFDSYHSYHDHLVFLHDLQRMFPRHSRIVSSGCSYEGRNITGIHIYGSSKGENPAVVLHGTVHAREWITTMAVEYVAYKLLERNSSSHGLGLLRDQYDFYIFPFVNPDGFVYTQTQDRFWRKNRQPTGISSCYGVDINRNWPYKWNVTGGASTGPCEEDFRGYSPGDTPEAQALSSFLKKVKRNQGLKLYWDFHSYSQLFMTRMDISNGHFWRFADVMTAYGYSCAAVSTKDSEYQAIASGACNAIKDVHGTTFEYGPICQTIYQVSGGSVDYVADVVKADFSITTELRDQGQYGFLLPASQILPTCEEMFAGFRYVLSKMKQMGS